MIKIIKKIFKSKKEKNSQFVKIEMSKIANKRPSNLTQSQHNYN